jgi:nucleotide-binding universal stress UspA family protein
MEIVVGVDGSPVALSVLQAAVAEAKLRNAKLHVVHVVYVPATWVDGMTFMPGNIIDSAFEAAEAVKESVWGRVSVALEGTDVEWVRVDLNGYPPDEVVDYAKSIDADLIVVGSRGFGDLKSLLLGSTSHRVSHLSPCDVLIVKTKNEVTS